MRGVLYASIFAFLLMACGDNNPSSSQDNEKKLRNPLRQKRVLLRRKKVLLLKALVPLQKQNPRHRQKNLLRLKNNLHHL